MKKIDLIALDLDGTALNPQNQVSPATADAVRRARESGIHVVVSTGRICGEARDFALMLGTDDQMVTSGGATLSSVSQERCTMRMSMPWEAAVRASAVVERICAVFPLSADTLQVYYSIEIRFLPLFFRKTAAGLLV